MATHDTLLAVARALTHRGVESSVEYPGVILTKVPGEARWCAFGTANGSWDGDLEDAAGIVVDAVPMPAVLSGDATDVEAIADLLAEAVRTVARGTR
jgi:hypothetical protein